MKNNKKHNTVCALLCLAILICTIPAIPAAAYTKATYDDVKNATTEEMRSEIEALNATVAELKEQLASAEAASATAAEKRELYLSLKSLYDDTLRTIEEEQMVAEREAEQTAADIAAAQSEYESCYAEFLSMLRMTYEQGSANYIEIIFGAASLSDLLSRIDRVGALIGYSDRLMKRVSEKKSDLENKLEDQQARISERAVSIEQYEGKLRELEVFLADNEEEYERIEAELAQLAGSATEASDRSDVLEAEFRELVAKLEEEENQRRAEEAERLRQAAIKEAERKRLEQEQARLRAIEDAARNQSFMWPLPLSCYHITYPFGTRLHPVYHTYKTHYGIDIAAPRNTSVYASKPGKVTAAQYHSSYGNYILIDHLDGTSTLYAHLNTGTLKVKKGDVVNRGDIIAGVGTTGVSTGYHLHFEVRVNGNSVNPMDYLPKSALPANLTIS
ncbi:MAG: peptidoglycan DD-metalloendopeptidase family protein [Clostridia bacterium]|nr:peptidoglycan DD-metalloendopeptidase family protein [Clostridia bacterium]